MLDDVFRSGVSPLASLSKDKLAKLQSAGNETQYREGYLIQGRGDTARGLGIVLEGQLRTGFIRADGTFAIAALLGPRQSFGDITLFTDFPRVNDMIAHSDLKILFIPRERCLHLFQQEPSIERAFMINSVLRTHVLLDLMEAMRALPPVARVARFLVFLTTLSGQEDSLLCRQEDLATSVGISRRTLSRALKTLSNDGIVVTEYGAIKITDRSKLIRVSQPDRTH